MSFLVVMKSTIEHSNNYYKRFITALTLMSDNLEEPMSCEEIATRSGISLRQMQRQFKQNIGQSPRQHYMILRLERARFLIRNSDMKLIDISVACGFSSASSFCQSYRRLFLTSPSQERALILSVVGLQETTCHSTR